MQSGSFQKQTILGYWKQNKPLGTINPLIPFFCIRASRSVWGPTIKGIWRAMTVSLLSSPLLPLAWFALVIKYPDLKDLITVATCRVLGQILPKSKLNYLCLQEVWKEPVASFDQRDPWPWVLNRKGMTALIKIACLYIYTHIYI